MPLSIACNNEQKATVVSAPRTAAGNPASIDGALVVSVISGTGTIEQDSALPLQFKAVSGPLAGDTVYSVAADADLGAGVVTISDTVTLTVTSAAAASIGLAAGIVEPK